MPNQQISAPKFSVTPLGVSQQNLPTSKFQDLPLASEVMKQVRAGPALGGDELTVLGLIAAYHTADSSFAKHYVLARLHRPAHKWLMAARNGTPKAKAREPEIFEIYKLIVLKLCKFFGCGTNELASRLDQEWLSMHQVAKHAGEEAAYLDDAKRERYRLVIKNGLIARFHEGFDDYTLASTSDDDLVGHSFLGTPTVEGEAGFVQSLWNGMYMAKHDGYAFHSQYMSGHQVACAGCITIQRGKLRLISNSSGHYRPTSQTLVPLLFYLSSRMVRLEGVTVSAFDTGDDDMVFVTQSDAKRFLATGGKLGDQDVRACYVEDNGLNQLFAVSGKVTFSDGRQPNNMSIQFSVRVHGLMTTTRTEQAKIAPDGTFALRTEVRKVPQKSLPGVRPGLGFTVTILGPGNQNWTLADTVSIYARDNVFDIRIDVPPAV